MKRNPLQFLRSSGFSSCVSSGPGLGWMLPDRRSRKIIQTFFAGTVLLLCLCTTDEANRAEITVPIRRCACRRYTSSHSNNPARHAAVIQWFVVNGATSEWGMVTVHEEVIHSETSDPPSSFVLFTPEMIVQGYSTGRAARLATLLKWVKSV